jgi:hypothetical protein
VLAFEEMALNLVQQGLTADEGIGGGLIHGL